MLDVAPFEFFAWIDRESLKMLNFPSEMLDEALDLKCHWVTEDGDVARMKSGLQVKATVSSIVRLNYNSDKIVTNDQDSFETCPPLDIALMGAHDPNYHLSEGEGAFIRKTYENCSAFLSICGGVFALLEAGLLTGKTAVAPRMAYEMMKSAAPHVNWVDKRWTRDGKIWSSSTLLNGTDLISAFAKETWGGKNGMVETLLDAGHWPARDVDFKDFQGKNIAMESFG